MSEKTCVPSPPLLPNHLKRLLLKYPRSWTFKAPLLSVWSAYQVSVQLPADKLCLNDVVAVMKHSKEGVTRHWVSNESVYAVECLVPMLRGINIHFGRYTLPQRALYVVLLMCFPVMHSGYAEVSLLDCLFTLLSAQNNGSMLMLFDIKAWFT